MVPSAPAHARRRPSWWVLLVAAAARAQASVVVASRAPRRNATVEVAPEARRGIILWADGRSGTESLATALSETFHLKFCNGRKEGFKHVQKDYVSLSPKALGKCARRGEWLTHIKPMHVAESITTAAAIFPAAWSHGFAVVVAVWRANFLAREVSSFELTAPGPKHDSERADKARERFCDGALSRQMRKDRDRYDDGVLAARAAGLRVFELSFRNATADLCAAVGRISAAMPPAERNASTATPRGCAPGDAATDHMTTSHHGAGLAARTSPEAAACVEADLRGTASEWMLDLARVDPP